MEVIRFPVVSYRSFYEVLSQISPCSEQLCACAVQGKVRVQPTFSSVLYAHSVSTYDAAAMSFADGQLLQVRAALEWFKMWTPFPPGTKSEVIEKQVLLRFLMFTKLEEEGEEEASRVDPDRK